MATPLHFTADRLRRLPPAAAGGRDTYADTACCGLFLRVWSCPVSVDT